MFKEIKDIKEICGAIISKSDSIKSVAAELDRLVGEIKLKAKLDEAANITLEVRKELANLFILNSNIEDSLKVVQRILDSLKKIKI